MKKKLILIVCGVFGFVQGALVSVMPVPLNFILIILFIIIWRHFDIRTPTAFDKTGHRLELGVGILTVVCAILLPIKKLDRKVGPMNYERMSLMDLHKRLYDDWRIMVMMNDRNYTNIFLSFKTDKEMSRREVLKKLAQVTDTDLRILYDGTGATFLFGADPSFTILKQKTAQQGD